MLFILTSITKSLSMSRLIVVGAHLFAVKLEYDLVQIQLPSSRRTLRRLIENLANLANLKVSC